MPEEITTTEPAAPESTPEPAAPEASHPTGVQEEPAPEETPQAGPDLSDAMGQLRDLNSRLDRAGVPPAQEEETLGPLLGQTEDEWGYEDEQPQAEQPQGQLSEDEQQAQQVQALLDQAVDRRLQPIMWEQEMDRRHEAVQSFAKDNPQITKPDVMKQVENELRVLDPDFGQQGYAPDPRVLAIAYRSAQAELATANGSQTSTPPAGGEQGTAEAVGQQGATLETGAGPGAPADEEDPYIQALTGGRRTPNQFGY